MTTRDKLLISLRIKGFGKLEALAEALAEPLEACREWLAELKAAGLAEDTKVGARLTPSGREAADALRNAERAAADPAAVAAAAGEFHPINSAFKALITRWQMREIDGKSVRNDHGDAAYDQSVLDGFGPIHADVANVLATLARVAPRFGDYARRLDAALARIHAGDPHYVAAPGAESYHTIWFELHQDLIGLLGTTRAKEAAAGRAV